MADRNGALSIPGQAVSWDFYRGRVGLSALLAGLGLRTGSSVAIQAFTCRAVPDALGVSGLEAEFVDIEPGGVNMSPEALAATVSRSTRVVVVQHTFGIPARIDEIAAFCRNTDRVLIEDCCHSVTSTMHGRLVGTFGHGGFTSFEWGKEVIAGVGGAAWANDPSAAAELRRRAGELATPTTMMAARQAAQWAAFRILYRPSTYWHLKSAFSALSRSGALESNEVAEADDEVDPTQYGLRMHPSARRRAQRALAMVGAASVRRRANCDVFDGMLDNPDVRRVSVPAGAEGGWVRYPLLVPDKWGLLEAARTQRVELADWYVSAVDPLTNDDAHVVGYRAGSCPEAERRATEIVTLPTLDGPASAHARRAFTLINSWGRS